MKKNIDYYPHKSEAHRHPKFKMLRSLYSTPTEGWAAEGRFWALNNLIAQSEDCLLNLSKKRNKGVFADELGMSVDEFDHFIEILCSEDVELLTQIEPDIYTTETVQETYSGIASERERAKRNYEKQKKTVNNTPYTEKKEIYTEKEKSYTENLYKVNKSEVNEMKLNKNKVGNLTFLNSHFGKIKSLFREYTKIPDPNEKTHLTPIAEFYSKIPEHLTENDIQTCIEEAFKALNRDKGVKMEFLISNIQSKISARWEEKLKELKEIERIEAEKHRKERENREKNEEQEEKRKLSKKYREFYEQYPDAFSRAEQEAILRLCKENKVFQLGVIIEPKMQEFEANQSSGNN